jgi:hypothetical protein
LNWWRKKWAILQRNIELSTQKIVIKISKIWVWDPGSEIQDPEKTYSGSRRGQKGTGSQIRIRNTDLFSLKLFSIFCHQNPGSGSASGSASIDADHTGVNQKIKNDISIATERTL